MVAMFKTLEASGLKGFLGYTSYVYEEGLSQFFPSAKIFYEEVVCNIGYQTYSISQDMFTQTFGIPTKGITEFN